MIPAVASNIDVCISLKKSEDTTGSSVYSTIPFNSFSDALFTAAHISSYVVGLSRLHVKSTTETSTVGTLNAIPVNFPFNDGGYIMSHIMGITFRSMNISQLVIWFFIYSFLGWCMECVVIRKQLGYWENRGFAKLPFCVIYGFGTLIAFNIFKPIEHNYIALYIFGCICATAFEYLTAQVMLKLFGEVWWNYDHLKFNYKGIICLQSTLAWGFVAVFIFGFLNKFVERFVFSIDCRIASVMAMILVFSYTADFMQSFSESLNMQNMDIRAEMRKFIKMFHR